MEAVTAYCAYEYYNNYVACPVNLAMNEFFFLLLNWVIYIHVHLREPKYNKLSISSYAFHA